MGLKRLSLNPADYRRVPQNTANYRRLPQIFWKMALRVPHTPQSFHKPFYTYRRVFLDPAEFSKTLLHIPQTFFGPSRVFKNHSTPPTDFFWTPQSFQKHFYTTQIVFFIDLINLINFDQPDQLGST